jgi:mono/diheme cytochrome c family protein
MSMVHRIVVLATAAFLASVGTAMMTAQAPPAKTLWDGIFTDAQASRGNQVFSSTCSNCHTLGSEGNRPLSGQKFWDSYAQRTVGNLFDFVSKNMPNGAGQAGTLSPTTYADLVALILRSNGVPAGTTELVPAEVANITIVSKDGPTDLPAGTLVRMVGCLTKGGAGWTITSATAPERTEKTGTAPTDATRPLGDRTMELKFVMGRLDANAGKRMSVTGLLIGAGGAEGINVSTVTRVADSCP